MLFRSLFTYVFQVVAIVIALWLSYKIDNFVHFLMYGIIALIVCGILIISSINLSIQNCKDYNYIDFACSLLVLGLSVWCVFSSCRLWL